MKMSGTLDRFDGTIAASGTYKTNYIDIDDITTGTFWADAIYSDYQWDYSGVPEYIVVTARSSTGGTASPTGTLYVEQSEDGTHVDYAGSVSVPANEAVKMVETVVADKFRARFKNADTGTAAASVVQTVRAKSA